MSNEIRKVLNLTITSVQSSFSIKCVSSFDAMKIIKDFVEEKQMPKLR